MVADNCACRIHITINPARIIYLNGVLDSYEGMGIMRTVDEKNGVVIIYTTTYSEKNVLELLKNISSAGVNIDVVSVDYEDTIG